MAQADSIDAAEGKSRLSEMFTVQKQASSVGLDVERDYSDATNALRESHAVARGSPRELLGLPDVGGPYPVERENWTLLSFAACERGFRENLTFSSEIMKESAGIKAAA